MLVAEKYRLHRQIGWSDEAEVHSGPPDPTHGGVPLAVKIRHGMGGPPRPDGNRARFLRSVEDQKDAIGKGCRQIAPIFEAGHEGDNAYYVTRHYQRSLDSLIQGRVTLDVATLHHVTAGTLKALEELRDRHGRTHGNLKPTNVFLDGKTVRASTVVLSDLALRELATGGEGADCYSLGAILFQLVRARTVRNFDWPIAHSEDWAKLGPQSDGWREFCNVLMSPDTGANPAALSAAREAFKNMRRLGASARRSASSGEGRTDPGGEEGPSTAPRGKGWLVGIGAGVVALAAGGTVLLQPADSKLGRQLRSIALLAPALRMIDPPVRSHAGGTASTDAASTDPDATPAVPGASPTPGGATGPASSPESTPIAEMPTPAPTVAEPTPVPVLPDNPGVKWIGYTARLQRLHDVLNDPAALDQPELLTSNVSRLKEDVSFLPIKDEPAVTKFLKGLPAKLEATGSQPDLPGGLWTKESTSRDGDVQSVVYRWGSSALRFQFIRVSPVGGNGSSFYLSATAVPVQFGVVLAQMAEKDGKGPLSGAASVKGPVAWEFAGGRYGLRTSWMVLDSVNAPYYGNSGRPSGDCPMNGLSAIEAVRVARAAGCYLPTLAQWESTLASPGGQQWAAEWQGKAKVRGAQWAAVAKGIQAQHATGAKLPNDQCFGDRNDTSPVGQGSDANLFFEPVGTRVIGGFAHLIGNVGQYVVDDARNPTKYYFAGGSAESAPSVFQSLGSPPVVATPFLAAADGGLRLAINAKGNGSEKNPVLDKLKSDLDNELARVQKLQ